jgi:AAA+ ATPase superfamily predicted ATPase
MMFVGREKELRWLDEQYHSGRFEMNIIYGRRRVGKTALIWEFIADKRAIYFLATQASEETNLALFSRAIMQTLHPGMDLSPFVSFEAAFEYVAQAANGERLILAIDEYPYLVQSVEGISSRLQRMIDLHYKLGQAMLILCGSSMHFMEQQVLSQKSPLYGRRTAQMKIMPFTFQECCAYYSGVAPRDIAVYFGITGGVAEYMSFIDPEKTVDENIIRLYFEGRGRLYEEPGNLLHQELRDPRMYNEVLSAIAGGASKYNEIATKAALTTAGLNPYLKTLMELHIIKKELPPGKQGSKKPIYRVDDGMYRFWYRFVRNGQRFVEIGQGAVYYHDVVKSGIPAFMGEVFERIVMEYMTLQNAQGKLPDTLTEMGRWWGNDKEKHREVEIDFVGLATRHTVLGEAKWRNEKMNDGAYRALVEKGELLSGIKAYYLFSKSGFSQNLIKMAEEDTALHLMDFERMVCP